MKNFIKRSKSLWIISLLLISSQAHAHCQIPCGIYDDEARIKMLAEHIQTIEKSMNEIKRLSSEAPINYNQLVRWISNKEEHAKKINEIVTDYFMAQRVKPVNQADKAAYEAYTAKLALLHEIMVEAMKAKQSVDLAHVAQLKKLLGQLK